jgi:hypothetical protein
MNTTYTLPSIFPLSANNKNHNYMKTRFVLRAVLTAVIIVLTIALTQAAIYTSTTSGNWTTPGTWGLTTGYPVAGDVVNIAGGHTITLLMQLVLL